MSRDSDLDDRNVAHQQLHVDADSTTVDGREGTEGEEEEEEEGKISVASPSPLWKRIRYTFIIAVLLWLVMLALRATSSKPKVIYAHRYSEEFKYRPAASPIITETLKDGRTRIRGADPTSRVMPEAHQATQTKSKRNKKRKGAKRAKQSKKKKN